MVFKEKEQKEIIVNQAWERLHQRLDKDGLLSEENDRFHLTGEQTPPDSERIIRRTTHLRRIYVAAVFAACVFAGWYFTRNNHLSENELLVLHNEANAPALATMLDDGSVVYLSEQATLKYPHHFVGDKRKVMLQGEAFFDVKKQSGRPFLIETHLAQIEVIGTSFLIKSDDPSSFLLSVREGEVRVTRNSRRQTLSVKAGETILFDQEQLQLIKNTTRFDDYFRRIHFKDESLHHVIQILNMHSDSIQLKIEPEIETRLLTFTLPEKRNIAEIAELICRALDLQYSQQNNTIHIYARRPD